MRRFYAHPRLFLNDRIELDTDETLHLRDVLRLQSGERVNVFDGEGREFLCEIESVGSKSTALMILDQIPPAAPESRLDLTLAGAILKGEKFDLVIQKAVELGVNRLVPLITRRGDVKPKDTAKKAVRWRKIALEAAKQSGRAKLMRVEEPFELTSFLSETGNDGDLIFFSERGGKELSTAISGQKITAVVGPEGGWDNSEISLAADSGFDIVTLGGRILRAETAAITVAAILQHRFGDLV